MKLFKCPWKLNQRLKWFCFKYRILKVNKSIQKKKKKEEKSQINHQVYFFELDSCCYCFCWLVFPSCRDPNLAILALKKDWHVYRLEKLYLREVKKKSTRLGNLMKGRMMRCEIIKYTRWLSRECIYFMKYFIKQ